MIEVEQTKASLKPQRNNTPWALENLPPFPAVATQLLQLLSREDVNLFEVGRLISAEPVFAADVLQIANSALYGLRSQVKTIAHAIVVLGLEHIRGISLTRAFSNFLTAALKTGALHRCWQNSLAGAFLAEKVARSCGLESGFAYTAGLLRDIGRLALLAKYPGPYANLLAVSQDNTYDLMATERELFDVDHCQAGYWLIEKMGLPPELGQVVARHHEKPAGEVFDLVGLVRVADLMAEALGFGILMLPDQPEFEGVLEELPEKARARFQHDPEELRMEIGTKIQILCRA